MTTATPARKFQLLPLIISLVITLAIGFVASMFTRPEIDGWYRTLNKPSFTPPNWAFPVAWTTLYILIATAAYLVWQKRDGSATFKTTVVIYAVQLLLNFSWSIVFFGLHNIFGGLIVIILLLILIILNISWFGRFSMVAAWLLVPYLLWVSYATLLNISIYILNK
ncbi:tryptophan-rich sensory protein [Mucilaginibacter pallidiroseus]|uniref:Tryptophan-rich sensory protein n=1 Tax=Mucilaginibacter pallidiroseus TaxID=2599295 RepID=A0A563UDI5_9SPHI|nr:TspO/MBR family protein [Mucilaginibacter pallidiroseus]TWR29390.1 tryptophan-rich sensory protein [Mucilaginibacter pallidiroseus]